MDVEPRYLTCRDVARIRHRSESWLARERARGEGPPFVRDGGRILYPTRDLEAYLDALPVHGQAPA